MAIYHNSCDPTLKFPRCPVLSGVLRPYDNILIEIDKFQLLPTFIRKVVCRQCKTQWYKCLSCENMRKPMTTNSILHTHLNNKHKSDSNDFVQNYKCK